MIRPRWLPTLLLLLVTALASGCVEVDQVLTLREDGSIALHWRLGLRQRIADRVRRDGEDEDWLAAMRATGDPDQVKAEIQRDGETLWFDVQADLPDRDAYELFRQRFNEVFHNRSRHPQPFVFPPQVREAPSGPSVVIDIPPVQAEAEIPNAEAKERWKLTVKSEIPVQSHTADRVEDGDLVWERATTAIAREGLHGRAVFGQSAVGGLGPWLVPGGLAVLLIVGAGALLLGGRGSNSG